MITLPLRRLLAKAAAWLAPVFLGALVAVPVVMLVWLVFFTETFRVQAITVVDARLSTAAAARVEVTEVVGRNILFLQTDIFESKILSALPQVRTVHIVRKLPDTLKVIIQEKEPRALLLSAGKYYFVDEQGRAYEEARLDTLPGVVLPTIKVNDQAASVTTGTRVVDEPFIQFVTQIQAQIPRVTGAEVVEIRIPSLAAREVHFYLSNNWQMKFDSTRAAAPQLAILQQLLEQTIQPEEKTRLQYVDLRIPNRVYYKTTDGDTLSR